MNEWKKISMSASYLFVVGFFTAVGMITIRLFMSGEVNLDNYEYNIWDHIIEIGILSIFWMIIVRIIDRRWILIRRTVKPFD